MGHGNQLVGVVVHKNKKKRKQISTEGPGDISMEFCYRYMEFSGLDRGASPIPSS